MTTITFVVPGTLRGKGRPRFVRATGRTYTPAETVASESVVRFFGHEAMRGRALLEGPVCLSVQIFKLFPQSWSAKKRAAIKWVTGRPDTDNLIKLIADSLNGICWKDDAQIAKIEFERTYTATGPERAEISISELAMTVPR